MNRKIDKPVLEKPIVGGSKDVWGDILNVNIDNTEKFHTQLLSDLETKDAELARLERDKTSKSDLPDLVHPIVDNYVESSVKPTINEYIDSTSKPAINSHVESKKQELNSYVNTTNKPELDEYTKAKEGELDTHTGEKKSELDVYENTKEGQLDSHTDTKKEELNQHTVQKQGQLDEYTTAKEGELDSHTIEKKNELNTHEKAKEKELDSYVTTVNKPALDVYEKAKEQELSTYTESMKSELDTFKQTKTGEIDAHTLKKQQQLDSYEAGKELELDSYTSNKRKELDTYTITKQNVLEDYTGVQKLEMDKHLNLKKGELDEYTKTQESLIGEHTKKKEQELDSYTNIKKEELNSHTETKESEITQVTETKKQEITAHSSNELDKFNQGAKQEADKQIGRVVAEGDVQVQRVKDESEGVIPRIEELESGKVSKSGDTMSGNLKIKKPLDVSAIDIYSKNESYGSVAKDDNGIKLLSNSGASSLVAYDSGDLKLSNNINRSNIKLEGKNIHIYNDSSNTFLKLHGNGDTELSAKNLSTTNKEVVSAINELNSGKVSKNGGTMTGPLIIDAWNNNLKLYSKGIHTGEVFVDEEGIALWNATSRNSLKLYNNGNTKLDANNLTTINKEVIDAINEVNSKKADLTGSTFTGLVAVKKDTNGEAMVALNSAYGNGDIYSGGSAKGVGFRNRTSGKGIFLGDDGSVKLEASNIDGPRKDVVECLNRNIGSFKGRAQTLQDMNTPGVYTVGIDTPDTPYNTWGTIINMYEYGKNGTNKQLWLGTSLSGLLAEKSGTSNWVKYWSEANFNPSTKLDKSSVVNDLTTGGTDKVLSAEQGKVLWDNKVDKGGYTGTAQNLKSEIDSKVSKSGDTINGNITIKNCISPISLDYEKSNISGGGFARGLEIKIDGATKAEFGLYGSNGEPKNIYIGKDYANTMIDLKYDGTTTIKASNLNTSSKEVIAAINELKASTYETFVIASTSTTNPAEYIGNTTWTRIGEQNIGGTTAYYWKRNS